MPRGYVTGLPEFWQSFLFTLKRKVLKMSIVKTVKEIIQKINAGVAAIKETLISAAGKKKYEKAAKYINIAISALTKITDGAAKIKDSYKFEKTIDCIKSGRDYFANIHEQTGRFVEFLDSEIAELEK